MNQELDNFAIDLSSDLLKSLMPNFDWDDEHLTKTPERFAKMLKDLTTQQDFTFTTFETANNEMVIMQDIPVYSLCAHHIIPFFGVAHVAYLPNGKMVGLSKLARAVKWWSRGLWAQENLTDAIANHLEEELEPIGVAVVLKCRHLCMEMRGVETAGAKTTTSKMTGKFLESTNLARAEFFSIINGGR